MLSDGLARFEPRNYGNVDRSFPVCRPPPDQSEISSNPFFVGGLRGALFVHIASFVIPRRAMPREAMSRRMTRLGTVVKGRACLDLQDLTAAGTQLRFFPPQARNDAINVGNFQGTQSQHVGRAGDALFLGAPVLLC